MINWHCDFNLSIDKDQFEICNCEVCNGCETCNYCVKCTNCRGCLMCGDCINCEGCFNLCNLQNLKNVYSYLGKLYKLKSRYRNYNLINEMYNKSCARYERYDYDNCRIFVDLKIIKKAIDEGRLIEFKNYKKFRMNYNYRDYDNNYKGKTTYMNVSHNYITEYFCNIKCSNGINCKKCIDCSNCEDCTNCFCCKNCTDCEKCEYCKNCTHSQTYANSNGIFEKCKNCKNCKNCENCENCENCINCVNCVNCKNCKNLTNAHDLNGLTLNDNCINENNCKIIKKEFNTLQDLKDKIEDYENLHNIKVKIIIDNTSNDCYIEDDEYFNDDIDDELIVSDDEY